jgi:2-amino-4-hydroxy-6-hydroxymethyldihydropteridine diphosphokinase
MHPPGKRVTAYIGLGSNLGDRQQNLQDAGAKIAQMAGVDVIVSSSFYESEPVGYTEQGYFLNSVLKVSTTLNPQELLRGLQAIENELKRKRLFRWGPRTIDLDILFYGQEVIQEEGLVIPHERLHTRAFVLVPLKELAPDLVHPGSGKTIGEHLQVLEKEGQSVTRMEYNVKE